MTGRQAFSDEAKAVLVTGSSSGIGHQIALTLAESGFLVFASVRKKADAEKVQSYHLPGLVPVYPLDLTNRRDIANAVELVSDELAKRNLEGLFALINNAGGGSPAPVELMDLDAFEIELKTRLVGSVALVQAFLPLIRKAKGRILWITTPAIIPTPYVASIHAADFAVNCLARTLDIELKKWEIPNVMIRCGGIKTEKGLKTTEEVEALLKNAPPERVALYREALEKWAGEMAEFDKKRTDPRKVAELILKVLNSKKPKHRYSIGHMARAAVFLETLPQGISDWILKKHF